MTSSLMITLVTLTVSPPPVCVCECLMFTPATAAASSDAIARVRPLRARTVQIQRTAPDGRVYQDPWSIVRAAVLTRWRGALSDTVEVWSSLACGTSFQVDRDYLLYAHWDGERLKDWPCRTKEISEAEADLEFLGRPDEAPSVH
jgi:hypothetical protein